MLYEWRKKNNTLDLSLTKEEMKNVNFDNIKPNELSNIMKYVFLFFWFNHYLEARAEIEYLFGSFFGGIGDAQQLELFQ